MKLSIDSVISRHSREVQRGEEIYHEDDPAQDVYIIQRGTVALFRRIKDEDLCVAILEAGDFFGELGVIENLTHSTSAKAVTDVTIVLLDRALFQKILSENPEIDIRMIRSLCHRLREANERLCMVLSLEEEARVADVLIDGAPTTASGDHDGIVVDRLQIANRAGVVQSQTDAIINKLILLGLIQENHEGRIAIVHKQGLCDFVEYSNLKKYFDPLSPHDLAQVAGTTEEETRLLTERVIRQRLADRRRQEFGSGLLTPLQRYLQLKLRFEFTEASTSNTRGAGEDDHEGAL